MKKRYISFYYIILMVFCLVFLCCGRVGAINEEQKNIISDHCESIRDSLKLVQKQDARARVYLGGRYETILSKFIMPLNVKLVENNISNTKLVENQNSFATAKVKFSDDYIDYQQGLEELVAIDCKVEPEKFYEKLIEVREERKVVNRDVSEMSGLISRQIKLVRELVEGQ